MDSSISVVTPMAVQRNPAHPMMNPPSAGPTSLVALEANEFRPLASTRSSTVT